MQNKFFYLFILLYLIAYESKAQDLPITHYQQAYNTIDSMLTGKSSLIFKRAVFTVENAYFDGQLNQKQFEREITILKSLTLTISQSNPITYIENDKENVIAHSSIFKVMTDTIPLMLDSSHIMVHLPFTYDFKDIWGREDWTKMFVSKLINTNKGNCHSLPCLFR